MLDKEEDVLFMFREMRRNIDCASTIFWVKMKG